MSFLQHQRTLCSLCREVPEIPGPQGQASATRVEAGPMRQPPAPQFEKPRVCSIHWPGGYPMGLRPGAHSGDLLIKALFVGFSPSLSCFSILTVSWGHLLNELPALQSLAQGLLWGTHFRTGVVNTFFQGLNTSGGKGAISARPFSNSLESTYPRDCSQSSRCSVVQTTQALEKGSASHFTSSASISSSEYEPAGPSVGLHIARGLKGITVLLPLSHPGPAHLALASSL